MNDDNYDWQEVHNKNTKKRTKIQSTNSSEGNSVLFTTNNRNHVNSLSHVNLNYGNILRNDEVIIKKGDVEVWMKKGVVIGDIESMLLTRLKELNLVPRGHISQLWNCLHEELKIMLTTRYTFETPELLKNYIYETFDKCYHNVGRSMVELATFMKCHIIFLSIEPLQPISYNKHETTCFKLLHIGNDYFLPVVSRTGDKECSLSENDRSLIGELQPPIPNPKSNEHQVKNQEILMTRLSKLLMGMDRAQEPPELPAKNSKKRIYYNVWPITELEKDKSLRLCTLNLKNAHSGVATIINKSSADKSHEISLMNRKNCGYNAFQGDKVYVKINDMATYTGTVMGVAESSHKPINSLYICKVCKHQGSLMKPLDNSFPKIHVDNEPGRRKYETQLNRKGPRMVESEQVSEEMRTRESTNYADNMFVTIFQMNVDRNYDKPYFINPKVEKFDPETCSNLFVVCYEYWDISSMYPNGTVVAKLSTYDSFEDSLHLIRPICKVIPTVTNECYKREINDIKRRVLETKSARYNVVPQGAMVFTVDNEETKDMDDALSYHVKDDITIVGVHITNITNYISPQHEIYRQAQQRFMTVYSPKSLKVEPTYLLDKELSTDALSLVPNKPRAVLSVLFHFKKEKEKTFVLSNVTFADTVIISKFKLSYKYVEEIITSKEKKSDVDEDLFIAIKTCYDIAKQIRRARLPHSYFVRTSDRYKPHFEFNDSFYARSLIEEFMIKANEEVAKKIYEKYPNMSLLRVQDAVTDYEEWVEKVFANTNMNFPSSLRQCCSLLNINRISENRKELVASRWFFNDFKTYLIKNPDRARKMLLYDHYINDFYVYLIEWYKINHPARYECSIANSVSNSHFSLNKKLYTHFTSPARRFSDIIVHRLLKSALDSTVVLETLTERDVIEVCAIGNKKRKMCKLFENFCLPYTIFEESPTLSSFILDCICANITNEELHLVHPTLEKANSVKSVRFSCLSLDVAPVQLKLNEVSDSCHLKWKKIIFSFEPPLNPSPENKFHIDNHLYDARLPDSAYGLFNEIRRSYLSTDDLEIKLHDLADRFKISDYKFRITSDSNSLADPIIDIDLKLFVKNTVQVQFCSHKVNGLKKIAPELLIIAPTLQLCLIHHEDPIMCFVPGGEIELIQNDIILKFDSITQYKQYFTPLVYLESLMEILAEKSELTLIDLPITWNVGRSSVTKKKEIFGIIKLSEDFYISKNIVFSDERDKAIDRYEYVISEGLDSVCGDLLCIRSKNEERNNYWIGHGEVLNTCKVRDTDSTNKIVFFMLTHCNYDIFHEKNKSLSRNYSVDVYLRSIVSKRQMEAVSSTETNDFLKQIILGNQLPPSMNENDDQMMDYIMSELRRQRIPYPNKNQQDAITKAMTEKLSLIWGPPGTGKTSIGCILAFAYSLKNTKMTNEGVVLYCGPSNDCVNLVAIEMQRKFIDRCPKMLRIFGKKQELADFPLPGIFNRNCKPLTGEMQRISLHFLIREMDDNLSKTLKNYDLEFEEIRNSVHKFGKDENVRHFIYEKIKMYRLVLKEAKLKLLEKEKYNMVLCTTSVSAKAIMSEFKITQVIIDEAGMCKEPETLIPIWSAASTVENVVLIGDHKQLRPIIHSNLAGKRGLQISMFERYQSLRRDLVTMLNYQYRMHPSICEFPSTQFYSSKLITNVSVLWSGLGQDEIVVRPYREWNGIDYRCARSHYDSVLAQSNYSAIQNEEWPGQRSQPYRCFRSRFNSYPERLVFIHIVGDESVQSVSTATGNENSRSNDVEVKAVGYIYEKLIGRLKPPRLAPNYITVLTQYKLQEDKLFKKCKEILVAKKVKPDPIVKTVIRSQGSENDYIIFSTVRSIRNKHDINENPSPGWERQYLGFITDRNQVNVALTRAKKGLIIIGNRNLLSVNRMWKDLINNLESRGCVLNNVTDFLS